MLFFWQDTTTLALTLVCGCYLFIDRICYRKPLSVGWSDVFIFVWLVLVFLYSFRDPSVRVPIFSLFFTTWCLSKCHNIRWVWFLWAGLYVFCVYSSAVQLSSYPFIRLYGFSDNPGTFGNILLPFFCLLLSAVLYVKKKPYKYAVICFFVLIAIALFLTKSRAAWLGAIVTTMFLVATYKPIRAFLRKKVKSYFLTYATLTLFVLGFIIFGLYKMRPAAADGRMLIYKVAAKEVLKEPFGRGLGTFKADYASLQAEYLKQNPDSRYAILADDTKNSFFDILQVGFEMGLLAMLAVIGSLFFLLGVPVSKKCRVEIFGLKAVLVGLFTASLFSYPLYQWLPSIQIALVVGMLLSYDKRCFTKLRINLMGFVAYILLMVVATTYLTNRQYSKYRAYLLWDNVRQIKSIPQNRGFLISTYNHLTTEIPYNGLLKYHYGITLFELGEYRESISILKEAAAFYSELNLWMCLAENYRALNKYDEAIVYFSKAYCMAPKRFMPLYKLMLVAEEAGSKEQAKKYALQILGKVVKIPSATVDAIKLEAQSFLLENQ